MEYPNRTGIDEVIFLHEKCRRKRESLTGRKLVHEIKPSVAAVTELAGATSHEMRLVDHFIFLPLFFV